MSESVPVVLGVDIGTSSSKGVLVDLSGRVLAEATREHRVDNPRPGWFEMDADLWWGEFVELATELRRPDAQVRAVGVSGMGPCVLLTDADDHPVRPAILYGVDSRQTEQLDRLGRELGDEAVLQRCGSGLTSQAAGAKVAWVADREPDVYARARRFYQPASWLVRNLTGSYVLDHHSASQCVPMYAVEERDWYPPWSEVVAPGIELPELRWADQVAGQITEGAARETGLPEGIPVITGTIDAWAEAVSADAHRVGDLMLMYGTTMFLITTLDRPAREPSLWGPVGALEGTYSLAGGMATSGAITRWLRDLLGNRSYTDLLGAARESGPGANGLLMLPYFAGERTPILDPSARGVIAGLTLGHGAGDLYRAALEATAFGVRHNVETLREAGAEITRVVAVGGGTQGDLWPQIVTDVTGCEQVVPAATIGACYGGAYLAARTVADVAIEEWNPPTAVLSPDPSLSDQYDRLYREYRALYASTREVVHDLAAFQQDQADRTSRSDQPRKESTDR